MRADKGKGKVISKALLAPLLNDVAAVCPPPLSPAVASGTSSGPFWVCVQPDNTKHRVEREVGLLSPYLAREVLKQGKGHSEEEPLELPRQVTTDVLQLIVQYLDFHRVQGRSDKERKQFDERFVRLETRRLCELTSGADALEMRPIVDLASRALARLIEGKSPEEIRETFHLPDDLTEEEKLEPVRNLVDDPRVRLLNRLYAKKRKELQSRKAAAAASGTGPDAPAAAAAVAPPAGDAPASSAPAPAAAAPAASPMLKVEAPKPVVEDTRSVEELLSFIGEGDAAKSSASVGRKTAKKKKKGSRGTGGANAAKADPQRALGQSDQGDRRASDAADEPANGDAGPARLRSDASARLVQLLDAPLEELFPEDGFDDSDLDPNELQEFERRLLADWPSRMQELLQECGGDGGNSSAGTGTHSDGGSEGGEGFLSGSACEGHTPRASEGSVARSRSRSSTPGVQELRSASQASAANGHDAEPAAGVAAAGDASSPRGQGREGPRQHGVLDGRSSGALAAAGPLSEIAPEPGSASPMAEHADDSRLDNHHHQQQQQQQQKKKHAAQAAPGGQPLANGGVGQAMPSQVSNDSTTQFKGSQHLSNCGAQPADTSTELGLQKTHDQADSNGTDQLQVNDTAGTAKAVAMQHAHTNGSASDRGTHSSQAASADTVTASASKSSSAAPQTAGPSIESPAAAAHLDASRSGMPAAAHTSSQQQAVPPTGASDALPASSTGSSVAAGSSADGKARRASDGSSAAMVTLNALGSMFSHFNGLSNAQRQGTLDAQSDQAALAAVSRDAAANGLSDANMEMAAMTGAAAASSAQCTASITSASTTPHSEQQQQEDDCYSDDDQHRALQQEREQRRQQLRARYEQNDLQPEEEEELLFRTELPMLLEDIVALQQTEQDIKAAIALCDESQQQHDLGPPAHAVSSNGSIELAQHAAQQTAASMAAMDAEQAESFLGLQAALAACIAQRSEVMAVAAEVAAEAAASGYQLPSPVASLEHNAGDTSGASGISGNGVAAVDWQRLHEAALQQTNMRWRQADMEAVAAALEQFLTDIGLDRYLSILPSEAALSGMQHHVEGSDSAAADAGGHAAAPMRSSLLQIKLPSQAKELQLALFAPIESVGADSSAQTPGSCDPA